MRIARTLLVAAKLESTAPSYHLADGRSALFVALASILHCLLCPFYFYFWYNSNFDMIVASCAGEMASMDHCRQWLKHVQGYVLQLQKQITAFASDQQISSSSSSVMSVDDACSTSSSSTTAGTAVGEAAWRAMCQDSAKCLSRVAEHMMSGAPEVRRRAYNGSAHQYNRW